MIIIDGPLMRYQRTVLWLLICIAGELGIVIYQIA